jgi:hypothetical protein
VNINSYNKNLPVRQKLIVILSGRIAAKQLWCYESYSGDCDRGIYFFQRALNNTVADRNFRSGSGNGVSCSKSDAKISVIRHPVELYLVFSGRTPQLTRGETISYPSAAYPRAINRTACARRSVYLLFFSVRRLYQVKHSPYIVLHVLRYNMRTTPATAAKGFTEKFV